MYDFINYVLWELKNSMGLVLLAGMAALAVLIIIYFVYRKKYKGERKIRWGKVLLWLMLIGYMAIVLYATILRGAGGYRDWNLHLFRAWREAWNNFSVKNWANVLLNVAMFAPLGFLLPLLGRKPQKWHVTIPTGFVVSLAIELIQLALAKGIFDVDDLFANTLGTALGYWLVMTILPFFQKKGKWGRTVLIYGCLFLTAVFLLGGIFVVYEVKEYGNLPGAAAYTNNTRGVEWSLACELPKVDEKLAVYRTQTRTLEECDAFADAFKQIVGTEYTTISYYQEAAYYLDQSGDENGTHFLFLDYLDPSYEYSFGLGDAPVWVDTDRETIEAALAKFPVLLPVYAHFTVEGEGWHSFTVEQHIDGAVMIDGTLRCRYAEDGTIREIQNELLSYTYYNDVEIISAEEAYARMCRGQFYDGGFFEYKAPEDISVSTCVLSYEIDTKGFYQPVYYFDVQSADGGYRYRIMIPAMA